MENNNNLSNSKAFGLWPQTKRNGCDLWHWTSQGHFRLFLWVASPERNGGFSASNKLAHWIKIALLPEPKTGFSKSQNGDKCGSSSLKGVRNEPAMLCVLEPPNAI